MRDTNPASQDRPGASAAAPPSGLVPAEGNWFARPLWIALAYKLLVSALLLGFFLTLPQAADDSNRWYSLGDRESLYLPFSNWDGQHYLCLAAQGYADVAEQHVAFYPLFPLLIEAVAILTRDVFWAALVVVTVSFFLFAWYLDQYTRALVPRGSALIVLVAVLCFPTAFFTCVVYSESLFLALLFGFLYHYRVKQNYWSVLFAALLPLTRGQGFFLMGAFLLDVAWRLVKGRRIHFGYELCISAGFLLGAAAYFSFYWMVRGNPFAGIEAQKYYIFDFSLKNLVNPRHFLQYLLSPCARVIDVNNGLLDKLFILFMLAGLIPVALTRDSLHFLFYFVLVYCPAAMGEGGAFTRYALAGFPLLALSCARLPALGATARAVIVRVLTFFVLLQAAFIAIFALNYWVG
jgi:hypothetical protein